MLVKNQAHIFKCCFKCCSVKRPHLFIAFKICVILYWLQVAAYYFLSLCVENSSLVFAGLHPYYLFYQQIRHVQKANIMMHLRNCAMAKSTLMYNFLFFLKSDSC